MGARLKMKCDDTISIFRIAGVIELLIYLLDYPDGKRKVDFRTDCGLNTTAAIKAQKTLLYHGLIRGIIYQNTTMFKLSETGSIIAKLLLTIKKKMAHLEPKDEIKLEMIAKDFKK